MEAFGKSSPRNGTSHLKKLHHSVEKLSLGIKKKENESTAVSVTVIIIKIYLCTSEGPRAARLTAANLGSVP